MSDEQREMTLEEWCDRLPASHRVNRELQDLKQREAELVEAVKATYRKHHLNDESIGWEELSTILLNTLCNVLGDVGYQEWMVTTKKQGGE